MARTRMLLCTAVTTALLAAPLSAQGARRVQDWQYRWYWGVKGGMMTYTLPTAGGVVTPQFGADWLITERRAALYVGYSQSFTAETDMFAVTGLAGTNEVAFDGIKRLQIGVVAMVGNNNLQPYVGGGFTIHILSNAHSTTTSPSQGVVDAIDDAASQAFIFGMAGLQYRMGRKLALFASYQYTPQGKGYMLQGGSSNFEGGVRYALLGSREEDPTRR